MIRYGLKLWTKNQDLFEEAAQHFKTGAFDFIEMYVHPDYPLTEDGLRILSGIPFGIHAPHVLDEFVFGDAELAIWKQTQQEADRLQATTIVVHPGYAHTIPDFAAFERELAKIDESRLLVETMPSLDGKGAHLFGHELETWKRIRAKKPMCLDFEKVVKSAIYQKQDWRELVASAMTALKPNYFHISGGELGHAIDQHLDLWASDIDWVFIKKHLETVPGEANLVFETPKNGKDLANDLDNMAFFRKVGT